MPAATSGLIWWSAEITVIGLPKTLPPKSSTAICAAATEPGPVAVAAGPDMSVSTPIFTTSSETCALSGAARHEPKSAAKPSQSEMTIASSSSRELLSVAKAVALVRSDTPVIQRIPATHGSWLAFALTSGIVWSRPCRSFTHDGVEIAFLDEGEGEPIVLVHGFASNKEVNWVAPGWVTTLTRAGRRVIALDNRGHGASTKLYDPAAYHSAIMAEDVRALIDHLGLPRADVMGYSMGARITAFLALAHPDRVRSAVLGGLGIRLVERRWVCPTSLPTRSKRPRSPR